MSQEFGKRLKELRIQRGLSQRELAKLLGVDNTTISSYENGRITPSFGMLKKIAEVLGVDISQLVSTTEATPIQLVPRKWIPLYDLNMSAGNGVCPSNMEPLRLIPCDAVDADCAFIVRGHSMEPEISEEDIVLVKACVPDEVQNGEIVVCIYANQFLVKRFYKQNNSIVLFSDNTEYAPIVVNPHERFELVGRVVEVRHYPKKRKLK